MLKGHRGVGTNPKKAAQGGIGAGGRADCGSLFDRSFLAEASDGVASMPKTGGWQYCRKGTAGG